MLVVPVPNIELTPARVANDPSVNPWPMSDVRFQVVNGVLQIYMRGEISPTGQLPGALVGFTLPALDSVLNAPMLYAGLDHEMWIDDVSSAVLEAWECDLKWCRVPATDPNKPIVNLPDGSTEKVYSKGGMWQVSQKAGTDWADTGFKPGKFATNKWNRVAMRMAANPAAGTYSVTSITDGSTYPLPTFWNGVQLLNQPMLTTNWTATGVQLQMALAKSGFAVVSVRNLRALFSDTPIDPSL